MLFRRTDVFDLYPQNFVLFVELIFALNCVGGKHFSAHRAAKQASNL
jgi:hypothetical protein